MMLEIHGARGSAPESGPQFDRYGGHTTCFEIALPYWLYSVTYR